MKKLFIVTVVLGLITLSACVQKLNESQIPAAVRTAFQKQYPGIKASWDREDANYEANFKQDGKDMSAVIDKNGTIVETETDISIMDLPESAQDYIKKKYPGTKIEEAERIVKADGDVNYEVEVHDKEVIFDANGQFVKETDD